jgi:hypothetical protein
MEVEVVARQVGEPAHLEPDGVDAAEAQRVARHLHHDGVHPALEHQCQQRLQIGRLRRGQRTRFVTAVDADADGADEPGHPARGPQAGLDQIRRRGLARRSGDADDAKPLRRVPVDGGRDGAQYRPRIGVHDDRDAEAGGQRLRSIVVGEHRDRAPAHRVGGELGTVGGRTGQRGEQVTRHHVLTAQGDPGDVHVGGRRERPHPACQRLEGDTRGVRGTRLHGHDTVPARPQPVGSLRLEHQRRAGVRRQRHALALQQPGVDVVNQRRGGRAR